MRKNHWLFIDTHVHIRACFPRSRVFDCAAASFARAAESAGCCSWTGVLMMTESATENSFRAIRQIAGDPYNPKPLAEWGGWAAANCEDGNSVLITRPGEAAPVSGPAADAEIVVVAGRQIDTSERLEVSALGSDQFIRDGLPIEEVLSRAKANDTFQILPWAPGKWSLARGRMLDGLLKRSRELEFVLGDNGGRPWIWPAPRHFRSARRQGIPVLPGSDPLPFPRELDRIGGYGVKVAADIDRAAPARQIVDILRARAGELQTYGRLNSPISFFSNEIMMQLTKKKRKRAAAARVT